MPLDNHRHSTDDLSLDACLEVLSNHQRREILRFFHDSDTDHAPVDELITEIIDAEANVTGKRPGHDTIASTMFHIHLPKLADAGVLDYDTRNLEVTYHGNAKIDELYAAIREFE
ncbi:ArsR family transcriptional regulator [Halosimplex aquaticum]|uniref:ArsR family transcriptional regulator n=1 Tax=Halosimplex aquaticum TaxID=3026162 RepID=A0ABD5XYF6_9EURY|nr:hypothetical protein [Halosimplex aquaticum]